MKNNGTMTIHQPRLEHVDGKSRLVAAIDTPEYGTGVDLWLDVEDQYGQYLCYERSDAFLVGMLRYALAHGLDIHCKAPVGEDLLYNLRHYLIPSLANHCSALYETQIFAEIDAGFISNAGGVGTGTSLGIDSMHTILHHIDDTYPSHRLTHLLLNNVGAYDPTRGAGQFAWKLDRSRAFAKEVDLPLIECDSNYAAAFIDNCRHFDLTNTYANAFPVLALQKLFGTYYYSSWGHDFSYFSLDHINDHDSAAYDLLSLTSFSSRNLRFHCEGGAKTRMEKTKDVIQFEPAKHYLHVCTNDTGPNCNVCGKCCRTLVTLDALDALDQFRDCFDIDYYHAHRSWYLQWMYREQIVHGCNTYTSEAYEILRKHLSWRDKLNVFYRVLRMRLAPFRKALHI